MESITVTAEDTVGFMFGNHHQLQPQTPISSKRVVIRKRRNNPLRNPISSLDEWTALKAEDSDTGSHQSSLSLLKSVSAGDIEGLIFGNRQQIQPQTPISAKRVLIRKRRNNPLRNPISSLDEWSALKAEDIEIGSHQSSVEKIFNFQSSLETRSTEDTEIFMVDDQQSQPQTPISVKLVLIRKK